MTADRVAEVLAERFGASAVKPLPNGAALVVGVDDGEARDAFVVPADGVGVRALTAHADRRRHDVDALAAEVLS